MKHVRKDARLRDTKKNKKKGFITSIKYSSNLESKNEDMDDSR